MVSRELLLREELELRGISYGSLSHNYPTLGTPPLIIPAPPPPAQGPLPLPPLA